MSAHGFLDLQRTLHVLTMKVPHRFGRLSLLSSVIFPFAFTILPPQKLNAQLLPHTVGTPSPSSQILQEVLRLNDRELSHEARSAVWQILSKFPESNSADEAIFKHAENYLRAGKSREALFVFDSLLANRPNSAFASLALFSEAVCFYDLKQYSKSEEYFRKSWLAAKYDFAERNDSTYYFIAAEARYRHGLLLTKNSKFEDAKIALRSAADDFPKATHADDALFALAQLFEKERNYAEANVILKRIITDYPTENTLVAAHIRAGQNQILLGESTAAIAELESADFKRRLIEKQSTNGLYLIEKQDFTDNSEQEILFLKAEALSQSRIFEQSEKAFSEFISRFPTSNLTVRATIGKGFSQLNLGKFADAERTLENALELASKQRMNETTVIDFGEIYRALAQKQLGKTSQALETFVKLSDNDNSSLQITAMIESGQIYYENSNFDKARRILERAVLISNDNERNSDIKSKRALNFSGAQQARLHLLLASTAMQQENYAKAEKSFGQAISLAEKLAERDFPQKIKLIREAQLQRGIALVSTKNYRDAIPALNEFLSRNPNDEQRDEAYFWLAESFYASDLLKNAEETYLKVTNQFTGSSRREASLYGLGWVYFRLREFGKSSSTFEKLLKDFPGSQFAVDVLTRTGDAYYLQKDFKRAAETYRKATRISPRSEQGEYCAYQLGQSLYRLGSLKESITEMRNFEKFYPKSTYADDALFVVILAAFEQKDFANAEKYSKEFVERFTKSKLTPRVWYALGDAQYNQEKYESAITSYRSITDSFPNSAYAADAVTAIQNCLVLLGKEDEATLETQRFVKNNPNSNAVETIAFQQAELFYNGSRYKNAAQEYEDFLKKFPTSSRTSDALLALGKSYQSSGDFSKSLEVFGRVVKEYAGTSNAETAYLETGLTYLQMNNPDKADSIFSVIQERFSNSETAIRAGFEQAYLADKRGDTAKAISRYLNLAEKFPGTDYGDRSRFRVFTYYKNRNNYDSARYILSSLLQRSDELGAESSFRIGELWLRDKKFDSASVYFQINTSRFQEYEDWYTLSLLNLGECYEQQQLVDKALEQYKIIVAMRPDDEFGKSAAQRIERIEKVVPKPRRTGDR